MAWYVSVVFICFFVKQKTAYEMRISDWSSDVCSSDLDGAELHGDVQVAVVEVLHFRPDDVLQIAAGRAVADVPERIEAVAEPGPRLDHAQGELPQHRAAGQRALLAERLQRQVHGIHIEGEQAPEGEADHGQAGDIRQETQRRGSVAGQQDGSEQAQADRKSTRLKSSH